MRPEFLPFARPSISDEDVQAVTDVLRSGWITTGVKCAELEAGFTDRLGTTSAVATTSATAAMHLALVALGIGPGDEVITPSMTWVSTVNMIVRLGATPVFVDVDRETLMATAAGIDSAVTDRTRAIIPVDYAGAAIDMAAIRAIRRRPWHSGHRRRGPRDRHSSFGWRGGRAGGNRDLQPAPDQDDHQWRRRRAGHR